MLFNKNYKKNRDDNINIEHELKSHLNQVKNDLNTLQNMRKKNTIGKYYDKQYAIKPNVQSSQFKSLKMISTNVSDFNHKNNNYLKNSFKNKRKTRQFVLQNRMPNYNINEQFSLKLNLNKESNEIIDQDFCISDDDDENKHNSDSDEDDIDFDLLLNNQKKDNEQSKKPINKNINDEANISLNKENSFDDLISYEKTILPKQVELGSDNIIGKNLTEYLQNGNVIKNDIYTNTHLISSDEIPKICYTTWHSKNLPPLMEQNFNNIKDKNPEIEFKLYDEKECRDFIKNYYDNDVLEAYDRLSPSSYKSDLWRYCILHKLGGIYLDIKYNTINKFKLIHLCNKEHFVYDHANNSDNKSFWNNNEFGLYTALIIVKSRNKILRQCIHAITEHTETFFYGKNALYPTGPGLLGQKYFNRNFNENKIKEIELFHHTTTNAIVHKNTKILDIYSEYRKEQSEYQNNLHYSALWNQRSIYNMKFSIGVLKQTRKYNGFLPKILCICHIGSYHVFMKMKNYIDNLISAHYDDYNLTIYFNIIETIDKEKMNELKELYPDDNFIISENYGFDIGSFFHILQIIKQRKEKYDFVLKIHTKTNNDKRDKLLEPILGSIQTIRKIIQQFRENDNLGIIASRKGRCIDSHTDFIRNQSYLQKLVTWFFNEQTRITKQPYVTGTMFWMRFSILQETFMKINITNIINSMNNIHTFDWNWYYYANNKYLMNVTLNENVLYKHYIEKAEQMNLSGNIFHAIKNGTRTFHLRDGMIEHAYERFFCYASHRLGKKILFIE
tara:strand:- start:2621 stop:4972 length:2352 start_codon:yes stop_codon:yes gene_type:complete